MACELPLRNLIIGAINSLHNGPRASRGEPDHNKKTGGKSTGALIPGDFLYNAIDNLKRFLGKKVSQRPHKGFFRQGSETAEGSQQIEKWK